MATQRRRRTLWIIGGVIAAVVVVAVLGPFVYIHFIEGSAPAKLQLPTAKGTTATTATGSADTSSAVDGTWNVGSGSQAGYRVQEVLLGQNATAVGRTSKVWGSLTVSGSNVTKATFTVDMASVVSDQSQRNARFDGSIMDVAQYPTAQFSLSSPISVGTVPAGAVEHFTATGDLTLHGVTKSVTFPLSVERVGREIDVLADITVPFSEWDIDNPSVGGFVTTADSGTLEVLLHLAQGAGNPASTSTATGSGAGGPGGGGPVTVPSTTVPPLSVPGG